MDIAINTADNYWNILKFLSNDIKLELIAKLSNSITSKTKENKVSASRFYGVWKNSDFDMSPEAMTREIKDSRKK